MAASLKAEPTVQPFLMLLYVQLEKLAHNRSPSPNGIQITSRLKFSVFVEIRQTKYQSISLLYECLTPQQRHTHLLREELCLLVP